MSSVLFSSYCTTSTLPVFFNRPAGTFRYWRFSPLPPLPFTRLPSRLEFSVTPHFEFTSPDLTSSALSDLLGSAANLRLIFFPLCGLTRVKAFQFFFSSLPRWKTSSLMTFAPLPWGAPRARGDGRKRRPPAAQRQQSRSGMAAFFFMRKELPGRKTG